MVICIAVPVFLVRNITARDMLGKHLIESVVPRYKQWIQ